MPESLTVPLLNIWVLQKTPPTLPRCLGSLLCRTWMPGSPRRTPLPVQDTWVCQENTPQPGLDA